MTNLTLRQLRYVETLARCGHFGRAAEDCSISQPAMSMQIKAIEDELGAPLFERGGRGVRLTGFGEEVARRAREIVRAVDDLETYARAAQGGLTGRLRIGVIPTIAPYLIPGLMTLLKQRHGDVDILIRETLTPRLVQELHEGRLDFAIVALPLSEPSLQETALFAEGFVLVRPAAEQSRPRPRRGDLRRMKVLLLEEGHCLRDQAISFCKTEMQPSASRDVLDASSLSTLVQMVHAGMGVTLIPQMAIAVETRSAAVSVVRFEDPQPMRTIGMVWRSKNPLAAQFARLASIVREAAGVENSAAPPKPMAQA